MKKKVIILLVVIPAIIACSIFVWKYFSPKNVPEMKWYKNERGKSFIESETLRITVKGFYQDTISDEQFLNMQIDEDTKQNITHHIVGEGYYTLVEMTRLDGKEMIEPNINYIVYDNNKNIIANSIIYVKDAKTNLFLEKFIKDQYNSSKLPNEELAEHTIHTAWNLVPVLSNESSVLFMIAAQKGKYESYGVKEKTEPTLDLSKIKVIIVNPSYKDVETKENIELENFIFEFEL